mgnify:FL=1
MSRRPFPYNDRAESMIANWVRWERTKPETLGSMSPRGARSCLDVIGAQSGARDGERGPIKIAVIVPAAEAVDALWWSRDQTHRRAIARYFFAGERGRLRGFWRVIEDFYNETARIEF